jgi:hypothetical protein
LFCVIVVVAASGVCVCVCVCVCVFNEIRSQIVVQPRIRLSVEWL